MGESESERTGVDADDALGSLPRRSAFAPSFFLVLAFALSVLALQPTGALGYELFGPSTSVDLGGPGAYRLDLAKDGERARIDGLLSPRYARYSEHGHALEVRDLLGTAVLVQRAPRAKPLGHDEVERFHGEGRLVRLGDARSTFFERLVRPDARYDKLREKFDETGALPVDRPAFLLLVGDLPRAHAGPIALPLGLWAGVILSLLGAARSAKARRDVDAARWRLSRVLASE